MTYVEQNCKFEYNGGEFVCGGAFVTSTHIVAYPKEDGVLGDWHGESIGTWRVISSWPIRSHWASHMNQIEATVNGVVYTGRGLGIGMVYRGKRKSQQAIEESAR